MNEYQIGYAAFASLIGLALGCLCYMLGGRKGKWKRRFIASLIIASTVNLTSVFMKNWNMYLLAIYPILVVGFSLGYGSDNVLIKVLKRLVCATAICCAGLVFCLTIGGNTWGLFIVHCIIGLTSVILGVKNFMYAAAEETFICAVLNLGLCMYPFVNMNG